MKKHYDCIFVNGDSYSAPNTHTAKKVYADFLSQHFNVPVFNFAIRGVSNDRILRSSIEYLKDTRSKFQNPLVIIGWSFLRRTEVWYTGQNEEILCRVPDSDQSRFVSLNWISDAGELTIEQKVLMNFENIDHKRYVDFYTNMYLFAHLLESLNLNYVLFSGADNTHCIKNYPYVGSLQQVKWVLHNPKIFKLSDFCIKHWAQDNDPERHSKTGHLSTDGHKKFSDFIIHNLIK